MLSAVLRVVVLGWGVVRRTGHSFVQTRSGCVHCGTSIAAGVSHLHHTLPITLRPSHITPTEHWVISVSCGWWHTAAAAVARSRLTTRGVESSTSLDSYVSDADSIDAATAMRRTASNSGGFLRGNIVGSSSTSGGLSPQPPQALSPSPPPQPTAAGGAGSSPFASSQLSPATPAAAAAGGGVGGSHSQPHHTSVSATVLASRASDMGGAIFTWGGDFRWQAGSQQPSWAKDSHQGCLGVGDLNGRLVPTLVKGEVRAATASYRVSSAIGIRCAASEFCFEFQARCVCRRSALKRAGTATALAAVNADVACKPHTSVLSHPFHCIIFAATRPQPTHPRTTTFRWRVGSTSLLR